MYPFFMMMIWKDLSWFPSAKGTFLPRRYQSSVLLVRRTVVRLRAIPRFTCQDKKSPLSKSETNSFSSGVSGWKLAGLFKL